MIRYKCDRSNMQLSNSKLSGSYCLFVHSYPPTKGTNISLFFVQATSFFSTTQLVYHTAPLPFLNPTNNRKTFFGENYVGGSPVNGLRLRLRNELEIFLTEFISGSSGLLFPDALLSEVKGVCGFPNVGLRFKMINGFDRLF